MKTKREVKEPAWLSVAMAGQAMRIETRRAVAATRVALAVTLVTVAACSPQQPPIIYAHPHPAVAADTPVQVFMSERDVHRPYRVLGIVSAMDLGKYQILGLQDALPTLERKTRAIGGNGLIVVSYQPVKSGIFSTGYSVQARAIRLRNP